MTRSSRVWWRGALAAATILTVVGVTSSVEAGSRHKRPTRFTGTWIFQSIQFLAAAPNADRCGEDLEVLYSVRGVDNLGGIFVAEYDQCLGNTETGQRIYDTRISKSYEGGATTEMVCGRSTAVRNEAQCSQTWGKSRCVFVSGTGDLAGIRGFSIQQGVETGTPCDGSSSPNSNDAGSYWSAGLAYLPRR